MGLIISDGDYGYSDARDEVLILLALLEDLCDDKLSWENILNKPELYTKSEVYNKTEIDQMFDDFDPIVLPIDIDDVTGLQDELDDRYTKDETDNLLDDKANVVHTHVVADITDLELRLSTIGVQIVDELPVSPVVGTTYALRPTGSTHFALFIGASDGYIPLNAVTYEALAIALATKQNKLTGNTNQLVLGDGTYIARNKAAVGLGNVDNTSDLDKPVSNAQNAINITKANDADVLHKTGNETISSGVKTFLVSPEVPLATVSSQAVNLGQVQGLISDLENQYAVYYEIIGDGATTTFTINHELNSDYIDVTMYRISDGMQSFTTVKKVDLDNISITYNVAPELNNRLIIVKKL